MSKDEKEKSKSITIKFNLEGTEQIKAELKEIEDALDRIGEKQSNLEVINIKPITINMSANINNECSVEEVIEELSKRISKGLVMCNG